MPLWDGLTTALSLAAQFLLTRKIIENWYLWIAADLIYVPLYLSRDLNLTALTYVVFLGLCAAVGLGPMPTVAAVVPAGKTAYILAGEYAVEETTVAATISLTTFLSVVTLLGWLYVLG